MNLNKNFANVRGNATTRKNRSEIGQILYGKSKSTLEKSIRKKKGWRTTLMKPNEEFHCQYEHERLILWCYVLPVVARGAISRWNGGDNFVQDIFSNSEALRKIERLLYDAMHNGLTEEGAQRHPSPKNPQIMEDVERFIEGVWVGHRLRTTELLVILLCMLRRGQRIESPLLDNIIVP
ncbi:MAG: hypothetical protein EZS28_043652, partial [Streblomastix strix]